MGPGDIVDGRFEIERLAGEGGMGSVFQARDRSTGGLVAIKSLLAGSNAQARFVREARVLEGLAHPGIVRFLASGVSRDGELWLAMEWLEGEDLSARLLRGPLAPADAVSVARQMASALAFAHARGVVHRDVKPSNAFLVDGEIARTRVLDFGIARTDDAMRGMTHTGVVLGTPGYMAPEQARGDPSIDARADVFALGCVLFECLSGKAPFVGPHVLAVMAKVLFEDAPRLRDLRPEVPPGLDDAVAKMMSRDRERRPRDGGEVAELLASIDAVTAAAGPSPPRPSLTPRERRIVSVLVAAPSSPAKIDPLGMTLVDRSPPALLARLKSEGARFDAEIELLRDGSLVSTLATSRGAATDHAANAARWAIALREILVDAPVALATGRAVVTGAMTAGEVIDRATLRLASTLCGAVAIDDVTAGLLDVRFDVRSGQGGLELHGERAQVDTTRTLLGRATPCVGRDREIGALLGYLDECVTEQIARAVLVTAPAGAGKSRLRHEFLKRVAGRDDAVQVWIARGDSMASGSPFALSSQLLQDAAGVAEGEVAAVRFQKLRARVGRNVDREEQHRVALFVGEAMRSPGPDDLQLLAARADPILMSAQIRLAFEAFVAAELTSGPLAIVLEDLHWGDQPSMTLLEAALRRSGDRPLLVLAFARPDVHQVFPKLFAEAGLQEMKLAGLTKRASERLVTDVLGERATDALVNRIVDRAAGNAFFLEELIRSAAECGTADLPDTILAMMESRLAGLTDEERFVIRAASIYGQVFWSDAVRTLVGERPARVDEVIEGLVRREIVMWLPSPRFPGEREVGFRHALVREAAYAMLTDEDRVLGHRRAAEWLEAAGERDALMLAEHCERGGLAEDAARHYLQAAQQAYGGNDYWGAIARAKRGVACAISDQTHARLRTIAAAAHLWLGDIRDAASAGSEALARERLGSAAWYRVATVTVEAWGRLGRRDEVEAIGASLLAHNSDAETAAQFIPAAASTAFYLLMLGSATLADRLVTRVEADGVGTDDPAAQAWAHRAQAISAYFRGNEWARCEHQEAAAECFDRAGDARHALRARESAADARKNAGFYAKAVEELREAEAAARHLGLRVEVTHALHNLGLPVARLGNIAEALAIQAAAVEAAEDMGDGRWRTCSRRYLAEILILDGRLADAEREARTAVRLAEAFAPTQAHALAVLARVLLGRNEAPNALAAALEGMTLFEASGIYEGEALLRLVHAEALHAIGDVDGGDRALAAARTRLLERAALFKDPTWRASFLGNVHENARTLELAKDWGVG